MSAFIQTIFIIVCILLILIVLLQKGRGGGLGAAFGDGAGSAFGTRTGDVLTWITVVLTGVFLLVAIGLGPLVRPELGQMEMPIFNPDQWLETKLDEDSISVGLSLSDKNQGGTIRYQLDDHPNGRVTKYSKVYDKDKIIVRDGWTLKARVFRSGADPSEIKTVTYSKAEVEARLKKAASDDDKNKPKDADKATTEKP